MKKLLLLLSIALTTTLGAQGVRSLPDSTLAPFYHGVASGDPLSDRVILWTRITPETASSQLSVKWSVATDTLMENVVANGTFITGPERDYTVKIDASGLNADKWYYYQFEYDGDKSIIGRTRTLPTQNVQQIRMGVFSCSNYQNGYFNAYRDLALRNTVDVVLHLGDYIYEYGASSTLPDRNHEPNYEIITVSDYRLRHSLYKLDADLRLLHQQLPVIAVWDDHETANNAYTDGAQNHTPGTEGDWSVRKAAGKKAYMEWMPIRENAVADNEIYRQFKFGNLVNLYMLDTRLEGRQIQLAASDPAFNDSTRTLISHQQFNWLKDGLQQNSTRWNVFGQQVMVAPLTAFGNILNTDQWDGYPAQRKKLYDVLGNPSLNNAVFLTGDIHSAWANDLPLQNYVPATGDQSVAVEFVATSTTSSGLSVPGGSGLITNLNPHIKYVELSKRGYFILDITPEKTQADFAYVSTITSPNFTMEFAPSYYTQHGSRRLQPGSLSTAPTYPPMAPLSKPTTRLKTPASPTVCLTIAPNPIATQMVVQFATLRAGAVNLQLLNAKGQTIWEHKLSQLQVGLHHHVFDASSLPAGIYYLQLLTPEGQKTERLIKM
jgi:alkaline phosphatase D